MLLSKQPDWYYGFILVPSTTQVLLFKMELYRTLAWIDTNQEIQKIPND